PPHGNRVGGDRGLCVRRAPRESSRWRDRRVAGGEPLGARLAHTPAGPATVSRRPARWTGTLEVILRDDGGGGRNLRGWARDIRARDARHRPNGAMGPRRILHPAGGPLRGERVRATAHERTRRRVGSA